MPFTSIIGVDCATKPNRIGVARAHRVDGAWHLTDAEQCSAANPPVGYIASWIREDRNALLALDAPLGWPIDLPRALREHCAGTPVDADAGTMFNRATDRFLFETLRQRPLDVGADRIARTAFAALTMLQEVRETVGRPIPLAWTSDAAERPAAIEVYPAATLKAHGLKVADYKRHEGGPARRDIQSLIEHRLEGDGGIDVATRQHDALDAMLCVIAGLDFLAGEVYRPVDPHLARREGWIWVRKGGR